MHTNDFGKIQTNKKEKRKLRTFPRSILSKKVQGYFL